MSTAAASSAVDECSVCGWINEPWRVNCSRCEKQLVAPNVRAALSPAELQAVNLRHTAARAAHVTAGKVSTFDAYEDFVAVHSRAVINHSALVFLSILSSQNDISANFYTSRDAGTRVFGSDHLNQLREIVDPAVFPGFHENIRFAVLASSDAGLSSYGSCAMVLDEVAIAARASVFDTNSLLWVKNSNPRLSDLLNLEAGHRATWADRSVLAAAKLDSRPVLDGIQPFADVLMTAGATTLDDDFVEVHIHGPLSVNSVVHFVLPGSPGPEEILQVEALTTLLTNRSIPFVVLP